MNTAISGFSLVVVGGVHDGRVIPILPPFLIGRAAECNLRPASQAISLKHCVIEEREGRIVVRDLDSTNGTFLNDDLLTRGCPLSEGDDLRVGPLQFLVCKNDSVRTIDQTDTIVSERTSSGNETVVEEDRMSEDEAARLLSEGDEPTCGQEIEAEELAATEEVAVPEPLAVDESSANAAKDMLRQMRRNKKK